jgi:hypothetical protein
MLMAFPFDPALTMQLMLLRSLSFACTALPAPSVALFSTPFTSASNACTMVRPG